MQIYNPKLGKQYKPFFDLKSTAAKTALPDIYCPYGSNEIEGHKLFTAYFNAIPNQYLERDINCYQAINWLEENYEKEIKEHFFDNLFTRRKRNSTVGIGFYLLFNDLIVHFDLEGSVRYFYRNTDHDLVETLIKGIFKFKKRRQTQPEISLLVSDGGRLETKSFNIHKPKLKIKDNYNEDFLAVHKIIRKRLAGKNNKGLVLLHGKPGTGKTTYIRYLCSLIKKPVIFLPPDIASQITSPAFISILTFNPNSILIIEDAENLIADRKRDSNSPVAALLNISDGLLADCLSIQVICSFNTSVANIDTALMRKGRLIANYEFKELDIPKAQGLSRKLGFDSNITRPMTLTEIYNQGDPDFFRNETRNPIGFRNK